MVEVMYGVTVARSSGSMVRPSRLSAFAVAVRSDHLVAHGLVLEMLAGPLPGIYDPTGLGRILFAFFAALAETERDNTPEGLDAAARQGKHGGRPPVITDDMLHTVIQRRAAGETVEKIRPDLITPTGRRKGRNPSVASIYRAITAYEKPRHTPKRSIRPAPSTRSAPATAFRRSCSPGPLACSTRSAQSWPPESTATPSTGSSSRSSPSCCERCPPISPLGSRHSGG
jgi:hypothetical protein